MCLLLGMGIMNAYSQTLIDGNKFLTTGRSECREGD